jgi:hypothetical protein
MDKFIQRPLTRAEITKILQFLSYHLNFKPSQKLTMIFAKTPEEFAKLHGKEPGFTTIEDINSNVPAFFDHNTNTAVFQAFSYVDGIAVPTFIIPMATIIHECIHFYQHSSGTYGSWKTMYEGTNEILSCFFTDDYAFDYREEAVYVFNLVMAINYNDFWEAINWMKRYTVHSDKNKFVHRSIIQSPTFSKFRPTNLMRWLDANQLSKIKNDEVRSVLTKYSEGQIKKILHSNRQLIT